MWFTKRAEETPREVYIRYRQAGMELNTKILREMADKSAFAKSARALDMGSVREIILDSEGDGDVLMEFIVHELLIKGVNFVGHYASEVGGETTEEKELLTAMTTSRAGLYGVEKTMPEEALCDLVDLTQTSRRIRLTDINLSRTMTEDIIMFIRPLALPTFTMTSGVGFFFYKEIAPELISRFVKWGKIDSAYRFARFFKLSKEFGPETQYFHAE